MGGDGSRVFVAVHWSKSRAPSLIVVIVSRLLTTDSRSVADGWHDFAADEELVLSVLSVLSRNCRFSNKMYRNNERRNKKWQKSGKPWRRPIAIKRV